MTYNYNHLLIAVPVVMIIVCVVSFIILRE